MDKDKLNNELKKMMNNKTFVNALIVLLMIAFLWLAYTTFFSSSSSNGKSALNPKGAQEVTADETEVSTQILDYETEQKQELKEILAKIEGVGKVEVKMYFESGEVKVPAYNSTTQTSETREEDSQGGTRSTVQENGGDTVVMYSDGSTNEPFIVQTYKPKITGIIIVAEGASNSKLRYDIQTAVSTLYNLSLDKVNVYPMEN
ncbi:stage III sporulation protein AG [Clostridium saudiense]|nr:stage III sporulation protein AG [Clostridium saudiense]MBM6859781.1 stage III sporulation protein AG [Clostridium saudiense]